MEIKVDLQNVNIAFLKPNKWNPNTQSDFIFDKEVASIKEFGFIDPILVRRIKGALEIIDGEHRWKAAKFLKMKKVPVNNMGVVKDAVARQLTVIMNETRGTADKEKLSHLLKDLSQKFSVSMDNLLNLMPFQQIEIETMINSIDIDWDSIGSKSKDFDSTAGNAGWKTVSFKLPESVANALEDQVMRFKEALNPKSKKLKNEPAGPAVELMVKHLASIKEITT